MASIKEVAKRANVSISTVSHVMNDTKYVSEELRKRIEDAIEELGYEVNPVASSLKSKKTRTIGVVITDISRIFYPLIIKGIENTVAENDYRLTFCDTNDDFEKEKYFIKMLESNWVDGIILASVSKKENKEYLKELARLGKGKKHIPIISIEQDMVSYGIDSVMIDNYKGARMLMDHLIHLECKKIVHILGAQNTGTMPERLRGYKDALKEVNIPFDQKRIFQGDFSPLSGYEAVRKLLISGIEFDSIFAGNDQMAIGAMKALKEYGLRIPEDIKVVGFDNTFIASIVEPSLTTVHFPKHQMGIQAAQRLIERIENPDQQAKAIELPIHLIVRQSTDLRGEKAWDLYEW